MKIILFSSQIPSLVLLTKNRQFSFVPNFSTLYDENNPRNVAAVQKTEKNFGRSFQLTPRDGTEKKYVLSQRMGEEKSGWLDSERLASGTKISRVNEPAARLL